MTKRVKIEYAWESPEGIIMTGIAYSQPTDTFADWERKVADIKFSPIGRIVKFILYYKEKK